jgi:hypothetical protein
MLRCDDVAMSLIDPPKVMAFLLQFVSISSLTLDVLINIYNGIPTE